MVTKTFVGVDAIAWLHSEFPEERREEFLKAMEGLLAAGYIQPLESIVPTFSLPALYYFTPAADALSNWSAPMEGRVSLRKSNNAMDASAPPAVQDFLANFQSLIWFTYRQDFPPIEPAGLTSDTGWGCMLRTGQMMLANALSRQLLGREFRLSDATPLEQETHLDILRLFEDRPGPRFPYSIHNIAHVGTLFKKSIGEWFGPTVIANVLKLLVRKFAHADLTLYLAQERVIYRENVNFLCRSVPAHTVQSPRIPAGGPSILDQTHQLDVGGWRPVIILSCVRLGIDTLNAIYVDTLAEMFKIPQMMGIIGGKPNSSLYFVGMQDDHIIYLDPHYVQPALSMQGQSFDSSSFHNAFPQKMLCKDIDPCMAVAFLCSTAEDFADLCVRLKRLEELNPSSHVVTVSDRDPNYAGKRLERDPLDHLKFS